jgi:TatD DNase family protein
VFFDSHCHITAEQFDADRAEVIQRAQDAGVTRMLTLATNVTSSRAAIELAERFDGVYAAVGIHPESVAQAADADLKVIRELAAHPKVKAIGEIGLDYYWDKTTAPLQQAFFEKQLELAAELGLPVAIHDRDAHDKILETLLEKQDLKLHGVLHAFSGGLDMAQRAIELGFMLSFGGPVTFKNNQHAPALIPALPLERILLETDSPYLTPHPYRGKRNEPAHVILVAERIGKLKSLETGQVATQTTINAQTLFNVA